MATPPASSRKPLSKSSAQAGVVPSQNLAVRAANPTATGGYKRTMAPLSQSSNPRVMNPKINTESWATSYAQARSQPKTAGAKASVRRKRQQANQKTNRRAA